MVNDLVAKLSIRLQQHLGVRFRAELPATSLQLVTQLAIVEYLTIENNPISTGFVRHWLMAPGRVNDPQPCVAKKTAIQLRDALRVGTTVAKTADHSMNSILRDRRVVGNNCRDAAHAN